MKSNLSGKTNKSMAVTTFFSWECPPRKLVSRNGQIFVDFDLDLEKTLNGEKIDKFTELPKVFEFGKIEGALLKKLDSIKGLRYNYFKLIADTNAYYLYPNRINSRTDLVRIFTQLKNKIQETCDRNYGSKEVNVILYTDLQKKFKKDYELVFNKFYRNSSSLKKQTFDSICKYLELHVGLPKGSKELTDLAKRMIGSYAAEGVVFELLNTCRYFTNPVWINFDEPDLCCELTNFYRRKIGYQDLPIINITQYNQINQLKRIKQCLNL